MPAMTSRSRRHARRASTCRCSARERARWAPGDPRRPHADDGPMSVERIAIDQVPAEPWKNGAGLTRELAVAPRGATVVDFDWRISVARIDRDAPFSAFDGIDRCITLLRGKGMRLRSSDDAIDATLARIAEPFRFAGD